jgi:hypothetical protein
MVTLKELWRDIQRGRCSGFPLCCVLFYSLWWSPTVKIEKNKVVSPFHKVYNKIKGWRRAHARLKNGLGYVPCPLHVALWSPSVHRGCKPGCACGWGDEKERLRAVGKWPPVHYVRKAGVTYKITMRDRPGGTG